MDVISSILRSRAASGDGWGAARVDLGDRYSRNGEDKALGKIGWFGRNFKAFQHALASDALETGSRLTSALGVVSVCMKMDRTVAGTTSVGQVR